MAQSVRSIASSCLGKTGTLSIRQDLLGVYANDNPQDRSLRQRLDLIENNSFVSITLVTIQGAGPQLQRDLDNTNTVLQGGVRSLALPGREHRRQPSESADSRPEQLPPGRSDLLHRGGGRALRSRPGLRHRPGRLLHPERPKCRRLLGLPRRPKRLLGRRRRQPLDLSARVGARHGSERPCR